MSIVIAMRVCDVCVGYGREYKIHFYVKTYLYDIKVCLVSMPDPVRKPL